MLILILMHESNHQSAPLSPAFNMFRRRPQDLVCAVPQDRAVPSFVSAEHWVFEGVVGDDADAPAGFNLAAATLTAKFNGYYLFQPVE
jgi:hypothetical protein